VSIEDRVEFHHGHGTAAAFEIARPRAVVEELLSIIDLAVDTEKELPIKA
jgi:hypothetical protein